MPPQGNLIIGVVKIDGRDVKTYNLRALRRHIGLVSQEPTLFSGTIRENIMYGAETATEAEVEAAARSANAHDFHRALDSQSEKAVQEALDRVMVGRTSVVVAHGLSTIRNCDVIAVLEKGDVVEQGTYFGLVNLQQGGSQ
ncbi:hypothetical protein PR202_gb08763 [Eleusine coracana subsp. coracana]|uniref:ABC transporter domain-containing protein n=1 Tax=Eleusine coracana subsp. coracana TaxID=191504 RepID=A0AAV5ED10_ELECO|nr:hypothetical protein PR202_gb08763 [Eleusine coracana subsp. coracana]